MDTRPLSTFRANRGGEPVGGQVTRVLASDMTALSAFLKSNFDYDTGPFEGISDETPAKRFLLRSDYNLSNSHKVSFRYNYLDSFSDTGLSSSTSALRGRTNFSTGFLTFQNSNYQILENIRSGIGEWNWVIGNSMANSFQSGYTYPGREPGGARRRSSRSWTFSKAAPTTSRSAASPSPGPTDWSTTRSSSRTTSPSSPTVTR